MPLTDAERARYRRNIDVPGLGEQGQERLRAARVVVVGAGGLASAALPYLVGAGIGHVTIVDGDVVEESNLQRQVLHHEIGRNKAESAVARLRQLNAGVELVAVPRMVVADEAPALFAGFDLVLDCTDGFAAKHMISDAARAADRPLVWATAVGMQGQCSFFGLPDEHGDTLWLRDLHPDEPREGEYPTVADIGVLGPTVGQVGALQAGEAIKFLAGFGQLLVGRVWVLDAATVRHSIVPLRKGKGS